MWTRRRACLLLFAVVGIALAVYFEPTHCVRGRLRGEAFYDSRPTSYWRCELARWDCEDTGWLMDEHRVPIKSYFRRPTVFESWRARWFPAPPGKININILTNGPDLQLLRDPDALPVLEELRDDADPKIRHFVAWGLDRHKREFRHQ